MPQDKSPEKGHERQGTTRPEKMKLEKKIELLSPYRTKFLKKNPLFRKECEELQALRKKGWRGQREREEAFRKRWSADENGVYLGMEYEPDPVVRFEEVKFAQVSITLDLRYSKGMVEEAVSALLDGQYKKMLSKPLKYLAIPPLDKRVWGNVPLELEDYDRYLRVWELREEKGMSWSQIKKELGLGEKDEHNARNWYRAASDLVRYGTPGFPAFPQE